MREIKSAEPKPRAPKVDINLRAMMQGKINAARARNKARDIERIKEAIGKGEIDPTRSKDYSYCLKFAKSIDMPLGRVLTALRAIESEVKNG